MRLKVSDGVNSDETVLYANAEASNEYDAYDSPKMTNDGSSTEIYTTADKEHLVINGMNAFPLDSEIPLGVKTGTSNLLSLQAIEITNLPPGVKVLIKDKLLGTKHELSLGDTYTITPEAVSSANRFSLIFESAGTVTDIQSKSNSSNAFVYGNKNRQIAIRFSGNSACSVAVFNSVGQKLVDNMVTASTQEITQPLNPGLYMVTIKENGSKTTHKIVIR